MTVTYNDVMAALDQGVKDIHHGRAVVIRDIKTSAGCADCGYSAHPAALTFVHTRGEKVDTIAKLTRQLMPLSELIVEIDKCDVVCQNCAAVRSQQKQFDTVVVTA